MLELIYKETRGTKNRASVRYVYGFTRTPSFAPEELQRAISVASAGTSVFSASAVKAAKEIVAAGTPVTVKGAAVLACLQGAHRVTLSKGERAYLIREMRLSVENSGFSAESLLKAA